MEMEAAKLIGAGLAVIALAGVGVGIGNIFAALVNAIGRNPSAKNEVFGIGILGFVDRSCRFVCASYSFTFTLYILI